MNLLVEVWVNFKSMQADGIICSALRYCTHPGDIIVGAHVIVGDHNGRYAEAVVLNIWSDDLVEMRLVSPVRVDE